MFIAISISGCMAKVVTLKTDKGLDNLANILNMSLLIVEPIVSFVNVNTNEAVETDTMADESRFIQTSITQLIKNNLIEKKVRSVRTTEMLKNEKVSEISEGLKAHSKALLSAFRSKNEALPLLNKLNEIEYDAIVISKMVIKIGSSGYIIPIPEAGTMVRGSTHTLDTKIVVISLKTGEQLWTNEAFMRGQLSTEALQEVFSSLFYNNKTKKEVGNEIRQFN